VDRQLGYDFTITTIAKNPNYISKDSNNMLNSCKSISIALKVTSNLNTTKGRACAKEPGITSRQRQALEVCSLVKS
jgi:hypothetical protein